VKRTLQLAFIEVALILLALPAVLFWWAAAWQSQLHTRRQSILEVRDEH
jgi:hypothetical protein